MRLRSSRGRTGIYRSAAAADEARALYEERLAALVAESGVPIDRRYVATGAGTTHVLIAGRADDPPVLALHGAQYSGPYNLETLLPLTESHRLFAPDVPGQFGCSAPHRVRRRDHGFGHWAHDVLDACHLGAVPVIGISFGAAILLDLATVAPTRLLAAGLIVPAGIAYGSPWQLVRRLLVPMGRYHRAPSPARLQRILDVLSTEVDDRLRTWFDVVLRTVRLRAAPPGPFGRKDLAGLEAPTLVAAAEEDVFFPRQKLLARAAKVLPNLTRVELLEGRHMPPRSSLEGLHRSLLEHLRTAA